MRIIFICGSLKSGYDGVGDYTRLLACSLIQHGHKVAAVAINDTYIRDLWKGFQKSEDILLPVFRIPSKLPVNQRIKELERVIEEFDPDWLSLQFVPFSFHSKGLPILLFKHLKYLGKGRKWHLMCHELWVGININSSYKDVLWGWLQKRLILSFIASVQPSIIHTHTKLYQALLCREGYSTSYLPLFSNIPFRKYRIPASVERDKKISFVVFGTIHPEAPIEQFVKEAQQYASETQTKISLVMIGRCGTEQERWAKLWRAAELDLTILGEQSPDQISLILRNATFGISTTPFLLLEKSGTVAAMRQHGLVVLCLRLTQPIRSLKNFILRPMPGIIVYQSRGNIDACLTYDKSDNLFSCDVSDVSRDLSALLSQFLQKNDRPSIKTFLRLL